LQLVNQALPSEKDFSGVLNAISSSALSANVILGDYAFEVGNLSDTQEKNTQLQIDLSINGGINDVKRFMAELRNQFPLSDITDIEISANRSILTAVFYYKPFPKVTFKEDDVLMPLSQKDQDVLQSLQQLKSSSSAQFSPILPSIIPISQ
jgi:hypothetical protein